MVDTSSVVSFLNRNQILNHNNQGILIAKVLNSDQGLALGKEFLYEFCDRSTNLFLSGGKTPKQLYEELAREERLQAGTVGLIDERYGAKFHANSNEKMLKDSGFIRYLEMIDILFYPMLQGKASRVKASEQYDEQIRSLFSNYPQSIGILGIGLDGHTAGIGGNRADFKNPLFEKNRSNLYISEFDDTKGMFKERITFTFQGLSMLDYLVVLVFGEDKKQALEKVFSDGSEEETPAQFFKRQNIASQTLFITDQQV